MLSELYKQKYRKLFPVGLTRTFARDIFYSPHTLVTTYGSKTKVAIFLITKETILWAFAFMSAATIETCAVDFL